MLEINYNVTVMQDSLDYITFKIKSVLTHSWTIYESIAGPAHMLILYFKINTYSPFAYIQVNPIECNNEITMFNFLTCNLYNHLLVKSTNKNYKAKLLTNCMNVNDHIIVGLFCC